MANAGALFSLGSALGSAVRISRVEADSQFSPIITYTPGPDGQPDTQGGGIFGGFGGGTLLRALKPRVKIFIEGASEPIVIAPGGIPDANYLPHVGAVLAASVAAVAAYKGAKALAKGSFYVALALLAAGYLVNRQGEAAPVTQ